MARSIRELHSRYEKYISPAALLTGFVWDNFTLQRIDLWLENLIMVSYLLLSLACIMTINAYEAGRIGFLKKTIGVFPYILQFTFGGLFSAFVIFYTRSASIYTSWPFLLVLAVLLVGNELFRERYERLTFQLSIYFLALFSYSVFALPIVLGRIGPDVFILSGYASLILTATVLLCMKILLPKRLKGGLRYIIASIGGIYLVFNVLYFANIIPPIPLSLKERGIYHDIDRTAEGYRVAYEPAPKYVFWRDYSLVFHWQEGMPVYSYSAVFAPTDISVKILHSWKFYDEKSGEWTERDVLGFPIKGGRDGGYRGYSVKYGIEPGRWRVDIITERGQVLGRNYFNVVKADNPPPFEEKFK